MDNNDEKKITKKVFNLGKKRTENMIAMTYNGDMSIEGLAASAYMQGICDGWEAAKKHFTDKGLS